MKTKMTRKEAISVGLIAAAGATLTAIPGCNWLTRKKIPVLTTGYIPILDSTPIIVAYEKGFFKEFGIAAEKPQLIRTWPALLEAFSSKKILLTHILLPQVIFLRYAQNINL